MESESRMGSGASEASSFGSVGGKIGLVGGGNQSAALLDLILVWPDPKVVVVVDADPAAPGLRKAQALGIATASHHLDVFRYPVDLILEATGDPQVLNDLLRTRPAAVEVIGAGSLRFFWELLQRLKVTQEQIIQAERLSAIGHLARGVAHEFNNILAIILGNAELMVRRRQSRSNLEKLKTIEEAGWRAAETVRRLHSFATTTGGREFVAVDLNEIILDAVAVTRPRWKDEAEARGFTIKVITNLGPLPRALGNPTELREMVVSLLFNALDAMPEGGQITITTRAVGEMLEMSVSDTGVGMSEEIARHIFDPFFTTKGPSRTGLGLSVLHGVLARHRGSVDVSTQERYGTTFIVRLRSAEGSPNAERPATDAEVPGGLRILVIEDEAQILHLLVRTLQNAGHTVRSAAGGQQGLSIFGREKFDIVVTDLSIPEVSGFEVARTAKRLDPGVPVILVTGWGDQLDPQHLDESGVDLVVAKPFRTQDILSAIRKVSTARPHGPARAS